MRFYLNYTEEASSDYIKKFASTVFIEQLHQLHNHSIHRQQIQQHLSISLNNRTDTGDYPVAVSITNGTTTTFIMQRS